MKQNISSPDRILRILISMVLVGLFATQVVSGTLAIILVAIAAILILTVFMNFCPIYFVLGIKKWQKKSV